MKIFCRNCKFIEGRYRDDFRCSHDDSTKTTYDWYDEYVSYGICQELNKNNDCKLYESKE